MKFIRAQHPKTNISPDRIQVPLKAGWIGQKKIDGMSDQIHINGSDIIHYTRHGKIHSRKISKEINSQMIDFFGRPEENVFVGEWHQKSNMMYLFDILMLSGNPLDSCTYSERFDKLMEFYRILPNVKFLGVISTEEGCMEVICGNDPIVEGLVFKNQNASGWGDGSIVRCLKPDRRKTK